MPKYHMDFNGTVYRDKMFNKDRDMTAEHDARWDAERLAAEEAAWREDGWR